MSNRVSFKCVLMVVFLLAVDSAEFWRTEAVVHKWPFPRFCASSGWGQIHKISMVPRWHTCFRKHVKMTEQKSTCCLCLLRRQVWPAVPSHSMQLLEQPREVSSLLTWAGSRSLTWCIRFNSTTALWITWCTYPKAVWRFTAVVHTQKESSEWTKTSAQENKNRIFQYTNIFSYGVSACFLQFWSRGTLPPHWCLGFTYLCARRKAIKDVFSHWIHR